MFHDLHYLLLTTGRATVLQNSINVARHGNQMFQLLGFEIHMCVYIYPLVLHWYALTYNLGFYKQNHREITEYDKVVTPSSVVLVSEARCGPCSASTNGIASIFISFPIFSKFPGFFCSQLSSGISVRVYLESPDLNFCANDFSIRKQNVVTHKCKF